MSFNSRKHLSLYHQQSKAQTSTSLELPWEDQGKTLASADNATTKKTVSDLSGATYESRRKVSTAGQFVIVRAKYDDTASAVGTSPVVSVIGLKETVDSAGNRIWHAHKLVNTKGNATVTLTAAPSTDITDGTYKYTSHTDECVFDLIGHSHYIVILETAIAQTGGSTATSDIQTKVV